MVARILPGINTGHHNMKNTYLMEEEAIADRLPSKERKQFATKDDKKYSDDEAMNRDEDNYRGQKFLHTGKEVILFRTWRKKMIVIDMAYVIQLITS